MWENFGSGKGHSLLRHVYSDTFLKKKIITKISIFIKSCGLFSKSKLLYWACVLTRALKELWTANHKFTIPGIPSFLRCNSAKYCYKWAQNPFSIHWQGRNTAGLWALSVCRSDGCLRWPVWTCSSGKSKSELPLSLSLLHPPSSCVTGHAQEQLLVPLPVSTTLHHSASKPLLASACVCVRVHVCVCVCCGSLKEAAEDLRAVIHSLSEANKPSVHEMSGMQRIPHGLFTENNPSRKQCYQRDTELLILIPNTQTPLLFYVFSQNWVLHAKAA